MLSAPGLMGPARAKQAGTGVTATSNVSKVDMARNVSHFANVGMAHCVTGSLGGVCALLAGKVLYATLNVMRVPTELTVVRLADVRTVHCVIEQRERVIVLPDGMVNSARNLAAVDRLVQIVRINATA